MDSGYEIFDFEPVFANLIGWHRICIDLLGMGATPAGNIQNLDDIFLRLAHFIGTALATSRFLIVEIPLGGYLGCALTNGYSKQVDGLLLRVPLIRAGKRDVDPFQPLLRCWLSRLAFSPGIMSEVHICNSGPRDACDASR